MPAVHPDVHVCKRRLPYAPRACDACRRRKGRCDGRRPCGYCLGRSTDCCYSRNAAEDGRTGGEQPNKKPRDEAPTVTQWTPAAQRALMSMVATMQRQSDAIVAHVRTCSESQGPQSPGNFITDAAIFAQTQMAGQASSTVFPGSGTRLPVPACAVPAAASKRASHRFYGPTSPDYSLIAAERRVQQSVASNDSPREQSAPCFDDGKSDNEEDWAEDVDSPALSRPPTRQHPQPALLQFLGLFTRREAIRLLKVYHEAIGNLHPICDIARLLEQIEWLYNQSTGAQDDSETMVDEDELLILNLALSIALCAEPASKSLPANILYNGYRDIVNATLLAPATSLRHVTIAILEGFYHFYMCNPCLAWRIIGVAGRIVMEMGLHSAEVCKQSLVTSQQRIEVAIISCTLLILDRQWSAATGLRPNFQFSDFEMAQVALAHTPYLKAMMVFTLMGDNFNEPITKAAQGKTYVNDDSLEVTAFQVKQWQKRALEKHNFTHPSIWGSLVEKPASWTLVLYLRANTVIAILLRSFFLANPAKIDVKKIKRGLDVVSDSIDVLSILDETSDMYRVQHPHLQHFLSSSCALLFLIVAYTEHRKAKSSFGFPEDYAETVKKNFEAALKLSAAYRNSFRQSHKLWKRIIDLKEPLARLGILPCDNESKEMKVPNEPAAAALPAGEEPSQTHETAVQPFGAEPPVHPMPSTANHWGDFELQCEMQPSRLNFVGALPAAIVGDENAMDVIDPLFLDWPVCTPQSFFSEIMF